MRVLMVLALCFNLSHGFFFLVPMLLMSADKKGGSAKNSSATPATASAPVVEEVKSYELNLLVEPKEASARILGSTRKFTQGMRLQEGSYTIEVSHEGFISESKTILLQKDMQVSFALKETLEYMERSCELGVAKYCFALGRRYGSGDGVKQDLVESAKRYERGCQAQDTSSCLEFGVMLFYGEGVYENVPKSKESLKKACALGSEKACKNYVLVNAKEPKR